MSCLEAVKRERQQRPNQHSHVSFSRFHAYAHAAHGVQAAVRWHVESRPIRGAMSTPRSENRDHSSGRSHSRMAIVVARLSRGEL